MAPGAEPVLLLPIIRRIRNLEARIRLRLARFGRRERRAIVQRSTPNGGFALYQCSLKFGYAMILAVHLPHLLYLPRRIQMILRVVHLEDLHVESMRIMQW
jgi:hypothetical protein